MAKAIKNFYWEGKYINIGDEAPEGAPASLTDGEEVKKKVIKRRTKNGVPKNLEDK